MISGMMRVPSTHKNKRLSSAPFLSAHRCATACRIACNPDCNTLISSTVFSSTLPCPHATSGCVVSTSKMRSRFFSLSILESRTPSAARSSISFVVFARIITATAITGPASGPMPTSSTPITAYPRRHNFSSSVNVGLVLCAMIEWERLLLYNYIHRPAQFFL